MTAKKIVIIGGVAGGASAAARARRLSEEAEIILLERGPYVSFANCGLPYHIGGEIADRDRLLVTTPEQLRKRFRIDVRTRNEVTAIQPAEKTVEIKNLETGKTYRESYDALILSPGAEPVRPPIPGIGSPKVLTLRNMEDMDRIIQALDGKPHATVIGGGYIGLEMAEALRRPRRGWWHVGTSRTLLINVGMQCGACALWTSRRQVACSHSSSELAPAHSIKWHHDTAGTAAPPPPRLVARWHIAYAPDQRRNEMWSLRSMDITSASCMFNLLQ